MPSANRTLRERFSWLRGNGGATPRQAYLFAMVATSATLAARVALDGAFGGYPGLLLFTLPILASAFIGGLRGGLMATALSCAASQILLVLPIAPIEFHTPDFRLLQVFLASLGMVVSVLNEALHRARSRSEEDRRVRESSQARLARDSALLVNAQRLAGLGIWDLDVAANRLSWSEETCRIFGVTPQSFGGTREAFHALVHPADLEDVKAIAFQAHSGGTVAEAHYRIVRPDGEVRTVSQRGQVSFDAHGQAVRRTGVVMDITERVQAEEAIAREHRLLQEAEARYRSLFENSTDGIFQTTPDGCLVTANPAMARMLGFASSEELLRERTDIAQQSYVQPQLREQFTRRLEATGFINGFEYEVMRKDGTTIWVSEDVRVVRDADGRAMHYEGTVQDITERRIAEDGIASANELLQRQKTELQVLFDLTPALIWFKDTDDRIVRVNQRVAQSLGKSLEEIEGRPAAEIYPRDAAKYREDDLEVIRSGVAKLGIVESLVDAAGNEAWVQTDKVPYFDAGGYVTGIVVMAQDVTERLRAEGRLRKTHNELIEVSRRGGMAEVASEVLHQVGNALNSINVSVTLVVDNVRVWRASRMAEVVKLLRENRADLGTYITTDPKGQHIPEILENLSREWVAQQQLLATELEEMRSNVDLVKRIVASQQSHAGAAEILESVTLAELLEEAERVQKDALDGQQVQLVRDFAILAPVRVAKYKAVQILVTLLRNARQACQDLDKSDRRITLRIARVGASAAISVTDNGAGIAEENLVRIFASGFTTREGTSGLGLHSAALAAAQLGGKLSVRSDGLGRGATFTLELPMQSLEQVA